MGGILYAGYVMRVDGQVCIIDGLGNRFKFALSDVTGGVARGAKLEDLVGQEVNFTLKGDEVQSVKALGQGYMTQAAYIIKQREEKRQAEEARKAADIGVSEVMTQVLESLVREGEFDVLADLAASIGVEVGELVRVFGGEEGENVNLTGDANRFASGGSKVGDDGDYSDECDDDFDDRDGESSDFGDDSGDDGDFGDDGGYGGYKHHKHDQNDYDDDFGSSDFGDDSGDDGGYYISDDGLGYKGYDG